MNPHPDYVLGVDPGLSGALALLAVGTKALEVFDMPVTDGRVDPAKLATIVDLCKLRGSMVGVIENVNARPRQSGMWAFALSVGVVHGVLGALGVSMVLISPSVWKGACGLRRMVNETQAENKTRARELAMKLWPEMADSFKRVRDDGRAESALIARHLIVKEGW